MTNALASSQQLEQHARFHKAMAEPVRLRVLALLQSRASLCVCDLVTVLGLSQSTVSRHLAYLKNQGLVHSWREGNWIHYALQRQHPCLAAMERSLQCLESLPLIEQDRHALQDYEQSPRRCDG